MSFDLDIPPILGDKDLNAFFRTWSWHDDPHSPVYLHIRKGMHIAPWAVTLFGAYAVWLREVRKKDVILNYDASSYVGRNLERIGLPQLLGISVDVPPADDDRIFPLTRFRESKDIAGIVRRLSEMLSIGDKEVEEAVRYSLVELLRNVVQHARSRIGGIVSAVFFPRNGLVDITVADIGCGLRASLRATYPEINTDQKAVRFSILPHVSGTFHSGAYQAMKDNAGLGLFFIKEIASRSSGGFFLGSGNVLVDIWGNKDGSLGKKYVDALTTGWRGTFALLQLRKDTIGEFDSLLAKCREIAAEVRKDRTSFAVDFIDEALRLPGVENIAIKTFEEDVEAAAEVRESIIIPALDRGDLLVVDFSEVRAATQSFVHALLYRVFRDAKNIETSLSVSCADRATKEAIRAVAAYAKAESKQ